MKDRTKKLTFIVTNYDVSIWPLCMLSEVMVYYFYKLAGKNHAGEMIGEWQNRVNRWAVNKRVFDAEITKIMLGRIKSNPEWAWKMTDKIPCACGKLLKFTRRVFNSDLARKSDEELYEFYMDYRKEFIDMYIYAWFPNSLEGLDNSFTKMLENYLEVKLKNINKDGEVGKYLSVLTAPLKQSNRDKESTDFLKIILAINRDKKARRLFAEENIKTIQEKLPQTFPAVDNLITKHYQKYCWLSFDYDGPGWNKKYFLHQVKKAVKDKTVPEDKLSEFIKERARVKRLRKRLAKEIGLDRDNRYSYYFELARELMYLKDYRKDALFKSYYHMDKLIKEIGRRLSLTAIQVKHILPQEMEDVFLKKQYDIHKIDERIKYSVLLYKKNKLPDSSNIKIFIGKKAKQLIKEKINSDLFIPDVKKLEGQSAYYGKAVGAVKLIFTANDIGKMRSGDILVSPSTNPNLLPAMERAAAIITDKGGITCHAAIVARELKIPCVIGTEIATKVLCDGDFVEVDANKGIVEIIKRNENNKNKIT